MMMLPLVNQLLNWCHGKQKLFYRLLIGSKNPKIEIGRLANQRRYPVRIAIGVVAIKSRTIKLSLCWLFQVPSRVIRFGKLRKKLEVIGTLVPRDSPTHLLRLVQVIDQFLSQKNIFWLDQRYDRNFLQQPITRICLKLHHQTYLVSIDQELGPIMSQWGAAIAQWIRLHLPSCRPGSSPKHTIYAFINL